MKSKIDEVWENNSSQGMLYGEGEGWELREPDTMTKSQFEKAVEELLSEKDAEIERLKLETEYFKSLLVTADFQHTRGAK